MGIVRTDEILKMAQKANTSVISFICADYQMIRSVIEAAENSKKPAIIMLLPEHVTLNSTEDMDSFPWIVQKLGEKASVPIAMHLDHSFAEEEIKRAIEAGFSSVMFDASREDLETNICRTRAVVEYAHAHGAVVEAELGAVGIAADGAARNRDFYTKPETVERFVGETGVDFLAISIGNAHGDYPFPPKLDLERLDAIRKVTEIPLVLHGGSGIPDEQLKEAFCRGISKFNYGTDVLRCYDQAIRAFHAEHTPAQSLDFLDLPKYARARMIRFIEKKMELCRF